MAEHISGKYYLQRDITRPGAVHETREVRSALPRLVVAGADDGSMVEKVCVVDPDKDACIYGDVVVLRGPIRLRHGRSFCVIARVVETYADQPCEISVSGEDGAASMTMGPMGTSGENGSDGAFLTPVVCVAHTQATDGAPGQPGKAGGTGYPGEAAGDIQITAITIGPGLRLYANGGKGGDGARGGPGGNGGNGGNGVYSDWLGLFGACHTIRNSVDWIGPGNGGIGGDGGEGGCGGRGGAGGIIRLRSVTPLPTDLIIQANGGLPGANGPSGAPGQGGWRPALIHPLPNRKLNIPRIQAPCGKAGVQTAQAPQGAMGTLTKEEGVAPEQMLPHVDPIQLEMLLQRLFAEFVVGGLATDKTPTLIPDSLTWIVNLLSPLPDLQTSQLPLEKQKLLDRLRSRAVCMKKRLLDQRDAFGDSEDSVPTLSYRAFEDRIQRELVGFSLLENEYRAFMQDLETRRKEVSKLTTSANMAAAKREIIQQQLKEDRQNLLNLIKDIDAARAAGARAKSELSLHEAALIGAIRATFNWNWQDLFSALEMIVFVPPTNLVGGVMLFDQGVKVLYNGMTVRVNIFETPAKE